MENPNEETFTKSEVLSLLARASELSGKNLHGVLEKIDPRLVPSSPLPDAAKPDASGRASLAVPLDRHVAQ